MVDMSSVLAELMAERAQAAVAIAGGLTRAAIAAHAEQSARISPNSRLTGRRP